MKGVAVVLAAGRDEPNDPCWLGLDTFEVFMWILRDWTLTETAESIYSSHARVIIYDS
jgi:hypothetical protein